MEVIVKKIEERGGLTVNQTQYGVYIGDMKFIALVERLKYNYEMSFAMSSI